MLSDLEKLKKLVVNDQSYAIEMLNDKPSDLIEIDQHNFHLLFENESIQAKLISVDIDNHTLSLEIEGAHYQVSAVTGIDELIHELGFDQVKTTDAKEIKAPMPGLVLEILVKKGQSVEAGENLIILEAMKMENALQAPNDGKIKSIEVKNGNSVEKNQVLINFE